MFLGPIEQSKPWDVAGIDGCFRFLKKFWALAQSILNNQSTQNTQNTPSAEELKALHKLIKKVTADIEVFSYNTSIPAFMVATSELASQKCHSRQVLEPLVVLIAPFCPHIAEELWEALGEKFPIEGARGSVCDAQWPTYDEKYLVESTIKMPVQFNGKVRFTLDLPADMPKEEIEKTALTAPEAAKYLEGQQVVKTVVVPGRIINIVIKPA